MYQHYIYIALGGALGAIARVGMSNLITPFIAGIPLPILLVNILGCFLMGILSEAIAFYWSASDNVRYLLVPGFLGGFTTFSSFALEFGTLMEKDSYWAATSYLVLSVAMSLFAFFFGLRLVRFF